MLIAIAKIGIFFLAYFLYRAWRSRSVRTGSSSADRPKPSAEIPVLTRKGTPTIKDGLGLKIQSPVDDFQDSLQVLCYLSEPQTKTLSSIKDGALSQLLFEFANASNQTLLNYLTASDPLRHELALGELVKRKEKRIAKALIALIERDSPRGSVRYLHIRALRDLEVRNCERQIAPLLSSPDDDVRQEALEWFVQLGAPALIVENTGAILNTLAGVSDGELRWQAFALVLHADFAKAKQYWQTLAPKDKHTTIEYLGTDPRNTPKLLELWGAEVTSAVSRRGAPSSAEIFDALSNSGFVRIRRFEPDERELQQQSPVLLQTQEGEATTTIRKLVDAKEGFLRELLFLDPDSTLPKAILPATVEKLRPAVHDSEAQRIRWLVIGSFVGVKRDVRELYALLDSESPQIQQEALKGLSDLCRASLLRSEFFTEIWPTPSEQESLARIATTRASSSRSTAVYLCNQFEISLPATEVLRELEHSDDSTSLEMIDLLSKVDRHGEGLPMIRAKLLSVDDARSVERIISALSGYSGRQPIEVANYAMRILCEYFDRTKSLYRFNQHCAYRLSRSISTEATPLLTELASTFAKNWDDKSGSDTTGASYALEGLIRLAPDVARNICEAWLENNEPVCRRKALLYLPKLIRGELPWGLFEKIRKVLEEGGALPATVIDMLLHQAPKSESEWVKKRCAEVSSAATQSEVLWIDKGWNAIDVFSEFCRRFAANGIDTQLLFDALEAEYRSPRSQRELFSFALLKAGLCFNYDSESDQVPPPHDTLLSNICSFAGLKPTEVCQYQSYSAGGGDDAHAEDRVETVELQIDGKGYAFDFRVGGDFYNDADTFMLIDEVLKDQGTSKKLVPALDDLYLFGEPEALAQFGRDFLVDIGAEISSKERIQAEFIKYVSEC